LNSFFILLNDWQKKLICVQQTFYRLIIETFFIVKKRLLFVLKKQTTNFESKHFLGGVGGQKI
jgi:hypothetical protein